MATLIQTIKTHKNPTFHPTVRVYRVKDRAHSTRFIAVANGETLGERFPGCAFDSQAEAAEFARQLMEFGNNTWYNGNRVHFTYPRKVSLPRDRRTFKLY